MSRVMLLKLVTFCTNNVRLKNCYAAIIAVDEGKYANRAHAAANKRSYDRLKLNGEWMERRRETWRIGQHAKRERAKIRDECQRAVACSKYD